VRVFYLIDAVADKAGDLLLAEHIARMTAYHEIAHDRPLDPEVHQRAQKIAVRQFLRVFFGQRDDLQAPDRKRLRIPECNSSDPKRIMQRSASS
jgi:hypothetical protein